MNATDTAGTIEHRIRDHGIVTVRLADWDAEIHGIDGDVARIRDANGGSLPQELQVERTADGIAVRQYDKGMTIMLGRRSRDVRLLIEVPRAAAVSIQTASGDAQATHLHGPLTARTASGDLMLVDVSGEVQAETVSGDVAIRLDGPTGLQVKTVSGDAIVEGSWVDRLAFTTTSGDLRITSELGDGPHTIATVSGDAIVTARSGIRVSAQTVAGDLSSDLPHTSEGRAGRRSLIVGEGTTVVQFRSVSGDLRVVGPNGGDHVPALPTPPMPPVPPVAPIPPVAPVLPGNEPTADTHADDEARLEILRALERGEIDVTEATDRLVGLDTPSDD